MVDIRLIPKTECLKDTKARVLPYWYDVIVPEIKVGITVIHTRSRVHSNSALSTMALHKLFTYLLTYLLNRVSVG